MTHFTYKSHSHIMLTDSFQAKKAAGAEIEICLALACSCAAVRNSGLLQLVRFVAYNTLLIESSEIIDGTFSGHELVNL